MGYLRTYKFLFVIFIYFIILFSVTYGEAISFFQRPDTFSALAKDSGPAVVNISTEKTIQGGGPVFRHFFRDYGDRFGDKNDPFNDFFDRFFGNNDTERNFKQKSLGSGFIIDTEGYIVTNNHVIEDADKIIVKLNNGDEFTADIKGRDPKTDLALIKIQTDKKLPFLKLGNSDELQIGDWVLAIGNPFGLEHTVTAGIVSAKGRTIGAGPYDDFIQTDASINPGNSGGPLLNMNGDVVGVNTAIIAAGQGIGFAIPVNMVKEVIEQLKDEGEVTRGWLGVGIQDLKKDVAEYYNLKNGNKGVLVTEVFPGDPAEEAGIKAGDIIIRVNGDAIDSSRQLSRLVAKTKIGEKLSVTVLRNGKEETVKVKIVKRKDDKRPRISQSLSKEDAEFGIQVLDITEEVISRFDLNEKEEGVIVAEIGRNSKSEESGLMVGDIILEINHEKIRSSDEYKKRLAEVKNEKEISLFIKRPNAGFLVVKLMGS
ncbi:MAG: DegQ family serine endoprotease [Desulfobacterales bacterium]|nr:DegQ family serine endoprotease [Desulfobacterales bacterium]